MWTTHNQCIDIGTSNDWASSTETNCNINQKPAGTTKCCCADSILGCCEKKDNLGTITTANMLGENCQNITTASTTFFQDFLADNNTCKDKNSSKTTGSNSASGDCSWKAIKTEPFGVSGGCDTAGGEKNGNTCSASTKPSDSAIAQANVSFTYVCCCKPTVAAPVFTPPKFILPNIQISIPGLNLTTSSIQSELNADGSYTVSVPWIGQYIGGIYNYGVGIAGILAAIMLMAGGVLWLISAGDASKITQAKELITGSITGLIILTTSYLLLYTINPELTQFKPIDLGAIKREEFEGDNNSPSVTLDMVKIASTLGVNCGQDSISQIVTKAKGKATYSQENRTKAAPGGFVYLDCSSFASFALKCATGKNSGQRSADIFSEQKIWDQKLESLQPGNMIGWAPKNNKNNSGHVIIYMGNGIFGDCHSGSGKQPGNCISNSISFEKIKNYATSHSDGKLYFKSY
ncbi:MAG: pilin [Patescibacteria group bacterium]|jgi:hypothetical protein